MSADEKGPERRLPEGVRSVVAVGGGKGGVGKSSVAANLAVSFSIEGLRVGLLDADVYGPNQPQMFGIGPEPVIQEDGLPAPVLRHGVKVFSMGLLMGRDAPVVWRGPLLHGAVRQMLFDVRWGELDVLLVDLPPGTGDVPLSVAQTVPLSGAVVVTTPQSLAACDVRRAVAMFRKLEVPVLGVVENMAEFVCPHCGKGSRAFGQGGAEALSRDMDVELLGQVPLDPAVCDSGEKGAPVVVARPESPAADAFRRIARRVEARLDVLARARDVD